MEELKLINATTKINEDNTFGLTLEFLTKENQKVCVDFYKVSPTASEILVEENNKNLCLKLLPTEDGCIKNTYTVRK